jgi:hypothetical protein
MTVLHDVAVNDCLGIFDDVDRLHVKRHEITY